MYPTTHSPMGPGASADLDDETFVTAFEATTLPNDRFRHGDHVRLTWIYLQRMPLVDAIKRVAEGIQAFAAAHGAHDLYHETVTWAFVILINERLQADAARLPWPEFARANPDLLRWHDGALFQHYPAEVLLSKTAKRTFMLPASVRPAGVCDCCGELHP